MTAFLLDTHTFLWALKDSENLSSEARRRLTGSPPQCLLSLGSIWELSIKLGLGKLTLPESLGRCLTRARRSGLRLLSIEVDHLLRVEHLPALHRDPFDRLLTAQCLSESLPILSCDEIFDRYGVNRIW